MWCWEGGDRAGSWLSEDAASSLDLRWWWGVCNVWRAVGGCLEWFEWFWVVAGSAGWLSGLRFCGFGVGVVGLVGSPCDGFCMVVCGDCCVGVMFENSTVCL